MVDTFVDKISCCLAKETNKRINQICAEKPEVVQNKDRVVLLGQDLFVGGEAIKRYSFALGGKEIASFNVGLERDKFGNFRIKASDVVCT